MRKMFLLAVVLVISSCSDDIPIPDITEAQSYQIIQTKEYPTPPDKKGLEVTIFSENSKNFNQRAQTAIKAASEIQKQKKLHEIIVRLVALPTVEPFHLIADVKYTPHKTNTWGDEEQYIWDVSASKNKIVDGKIEEEGEKYPLNYVTRQKYLQK